MSLKQFIKSRGLEIRSDPVTGRETVDLRDLETELKRANVEKIQADRIRKAPVDTLIAEELETLLDSEEEAELQQL